MNSLIDLEVQISEQANEEAHSVGQYLPTEIVYACVRCPFSPTHLVSEAATMD